MPFAPGPTKTRARRHRKSLVLLTNLAVSAHRGPLRQADGSRLDRFCTLWSLHPYDRSTCHVCRCRRLDLGCRYGPLRGASPPIRTEVRARSRSTPPRGNGALPQGPRSLADRPGTSDRVEFAHARVDSRASREPSSAGNTASLRETFKLTHEPIVNCFSSGP